MFSGGLDSLGGAIQEAIADKRSVALVSHRSSPKIDNRQRALLEDLKKHNPPTQPFHVPVWINKEKALGREYTQRTRSFLYASLGVRIPAMADSIPDRPPKCPPSDRNAVRHDAATLSAIRPESCPP